MTQRQYIEEFKRKHDFENSTQVDGDIYAFDGCYFTVKEIKHDINEVVPVGYARLYANESRDGGKTASYPEWLNEHFFF